MSGRAAAICRRLLGTIPLILGVGVIVFAFMRLLPGDPVDIMMGKGGAVSAEEMAAQRREFALDQPLPKQLGLFLTRAAQGDLGTSFVKRRPVARLIWETLPATLELAAAAVLLAVAVGVPVGVLAAIRRGSWLDRLSMAVTYLGVSMPAFWLGIVAIILFAVKLGWFPTSGRASMASLLIPPTTGFLIVDALLAGRVAAAWDALRHLILPAAALALAVAAILARMVRSSMLEVLRQDYVRTARAKGLGELRVLFRHAMKNALIPAVTVVGLQIGALLGGNMVVETVFGWPGMGRLAVDAIFNRDYPLVQGVVMVYAITFVLANLAVDLLYSVLDPKIRV
ncbi:MAG TPA: ABC transporter permease [Candidatus Methylomirabilis sp.]|nr:ABC transporter permease [Candidatus Methylomirabilis sp.]